LAPVRVSPRLTPWTGFPSPCGKAPAWTGHRDCRYPSCSCQTFVQGVKEKFVVQATHNLVFPAHDAKGIDAFCRSCQCGRSVSEVPRTIAMQPVDFAHFKRKPRIVAFADHQTLGRFRLPCLWSFVSVGYSQNDPERD